MVWMRSRLSIFVFTVISICIMYYLGIVRQQTYFSIHGAIIQDAGKHSGYRKRIFQDAQDCQGFYDFRNNGMSIYYDEGSKDLKIRILFKLESNALVFLGRLAGYKVGGQFHNKCNIPFDESIEVFESGESSKAIFVTHYLKSDSTSPDNSRADTISSTEITNAGSPEHALMSLENLSKLPKGDCVYRCHIAPQAYFKEYKDDSSNVIYGSHLFHRYFDGDSQRLPEGNTNPCWGTAPQLAIEFIEGGEKKMFSGVVYFQIHVFIRFRDPEIARAMDSSWREGFETPDELTVKSYYYGQDVDKARQFLEIKNGETQKRWLVLDCRAGDEDNDD